MSELIGVNPKYVLKKGTMTTKIGMADLDENRGSITTWASEAASGGQRFVNGDVLFARITPCLENGKTAIVDMLPDGRVGFGSTEFIVLSPKGDVGTSWIYGFTRHPAVREWARLGMTGTSGRQRLQADRFDLYRIESPNPEKLRAFDAQFTPMLHYSSILRDENHRLAELRDTLLPELMSGRLRVAEAQDAVAHAVGED